MRRSIWIGAILAICLVTAVAIANNAAWKEYLTPMNGVVLKKAKVRLGDIVNWASDKDKGNALAKTKAVACLNDHEGTNEYHAARVYVAHLHAAKAFDNTTTSPDRVKYWNLCIAELDHDTNGGGLPGNSLIRPKKDDKK